MKKRAKIIAIVSTLCLCLSLFVVGVLSVSTTSLSVTSSLSFKSNGAYVMVDGELRQGATKDSATLQSGAPATYTYKGYSYNCIGGTGADKDKPDGTASLENFVDASGAPNAPWAIGEINFTSELPVAVYHFTFTNYSAMMVFVSVSSNIQELNTDLAGKVSIIESFESGNTIDAYDGTTAKTIVYTITVEITDYTTSFEDKQLDITINFSTDLPDQRDYFRYNTAGTQITGLSEKYFEDNPSVLIVPAYSKSGQKLTIKSGTYTSVGYTATFNGLVSPTVILQEGLTSVPSSAFDGCSSLSSITIPSTVTSIGSSAFRNCSSLSSINIPDGVTSIGISAFYGCSSLSSITIPSTVTSIGSSVFSYCSSLSSINIPEGVTEIGSSAFSGCSSLSSIILPESVTKIGSGAFQDCSSLSSISLPNSVKSIGDYAFWGCSSLSSINIPDGVTSIGNSAFSGCSSLSSINIPDGVTGIDDSAFNGCSSLSSINIPDSVTSIGSFAFNGCSSLSSINIPDGVTSIGNYTFDGCSSLSSVTFGENSKLTSIGSFAFRSCSSLSSINIPDGVTRIGSRAFEDCSSLSSISLPNSVKSIGDYAFYMCYALVEVYNYSTHITVNKGATNNGYLGKYALYVYNVNGTEPEPTKISVDGNVQYYDDGTDIIAIGTYGNRNAINEITFKDDTTKINTNAFDGCRALTSVTLPNSVTSIGVSAFYMCYALVEVYNYTGLNITATTSNGYVGYYAKVVKNSSNGLLTEETRIIREDGMQYYKNDNGTYIALSPIDRVSIKEVNIKDDTTEINQYAFYECNNLTSVSLPNSVTSIGSYAFSGCSSLSSITIPAGVKSIGSFAFDGCNNVTLDLTKVVWADLTLGSNSIHPNSSDASIVIIVAENVDFETIIKPRLTTAVGSSYSDTIQIKQGTTTYVWNGSDWVEQTA